ncbi:T6SS immunity protein Tli3 family protein, partial [Klebsiella michiganensis]
MLVVSGCGAKEPPMQVVYRFDDHRYLELKGWNCEGELWYTDTQRGIHSQ